ASELAERRATAVEQLGADVESALADLNMGSTRFGVNLATSPDPEGLSVDRYGPEPVAFDQKGTERVEFRISANAGEAMKPLARVASGGETARLMLALKSILAAEDPTGTLVFDEIDMGVGGRSGQVVGEKLWRLTNGHQVIVITHLAQIAAFADAHFRIE